MLFVFYYQPIQFTKQICLLCLIPERVLLRIVERI